MLEQLNLTEIKNTTLLSIIDEFLFNNGIVVLEDHIDNFFNICMLGTNYKFMHKIDIEIYFENSNYKYYPIKVGYETTYTNSRTTIDYIRQHLFDNRKENDNENR